MKIVVTKLHVYGCKIYQILFQLGCTSDPTGGAHGTFLDLLAGM